MVKAADLICKIRKWPKTWAPEDMFDTKYASVALFDKDESRFVKSQFWDILCIECHTYSSV